eukprot:3207774-Rhodomonas_salina.1
MEGGRRGTVCCQSRAGDARCAEGAGGVGADPAAQRSSEQSSRWAEQSESESAKRQGRVQSGRELGGRGACGAGRGWICVVVAQRERERQRGR